LLLRFLTATGDNTKSMNDLLFGNLSASSHWTYSLRKTMFGVIIY
jgi:hypothetical protein